MSIFAHSASTLSTLVLIFYDKPTGIALAGGYIRLDPILTTIIRYNLFIDMPWLYKYCLYGHHGPYVKFIRQRTLLWVLLRQKQLSPKQLLVRCRHFQRNEAHLRLQQMPRPA